MFGGCRDMKYGRKGKDTVFFFFSVFRYTSLYKRDTMIKTLASQAKLLSTSYQMVRHLDLKQLGPNSALTLKTNMHKHTQSAAKFLRDSLISSALCVYICVLVVPRPVSLAGSVSMPQCYAHWV